MTLPQLDSDRLFLCDGGLETTLVFHDGIELLDFAAFPLLDTSDGRQALCRYYAPYLDIAERCDHGMVLDTLLHSASAIDRGASWARRISGIQANASRLRHAELDAATSLDRGDIAELAQLYQQLHTELPIRVVGGCCGTDHEHVAAIAATLDPPTNH